MKPAQSLWLVANASSGGNDDATHKALERSFAKAGIRIAGRTQFPRDVVPTPATLDAAGIELLVVFAGDGTINSTIAALAGWRGAVLVLPGGTMNLLYHRLHGEREYDEVVSDAAGGLLLRHRPGIIDAATGAKESSASDQALAGLIAGPGTSWNRVREAMRDKAVLAMAEHTVSALDETLAGPMVAVSEPVMGRAEGYPLLLLDPHDDGIEVIAFYAETAGEFVDQGFALLSRDFRQGPHEVLGRAERVVLSSSDSEPFGLLVDGEPAIARANAEFVLAACPVDLLASSNDG